MNTSCGCRRCLDESGAHELVMGLKFPITSMQMILCPVCGNKRCPHATDHRLECTDSNEPGQPGSYYA